MREISKVALLPAKFGKASEDEKWVKSLPDKGFADILCNFTFFKERIIALDFGLSRLMFKYMEPIFYYQKYRKIR